MRHDLEAHDLLAELIRASRLDGGAVRRGPAAVTPALLEERPAATADAVALPPPAAERDPEDVLHERTSIRWYAPEPLSANETAAVLRAVVGADARLYPGERGAGLELEILLAAFRIDSVRPALYTVAHDGAALVLCGDLPAAERAQELVLQREFAAAPALVIVLGDLAAAEVRHGAHGHRLLLQRAGAAAHAGWLAAIGCGLVGSVFAGLLPGSLRALAAVDGARRAQLLALAVGRPTSTDGNFNGKEQL